MNDRLAERLAQTLHRQADLIDDGPRFSTGDIVLDGRCAVSRRRRRAIGVAAAVAVLGLVAGLVLAVRPGHGDHPRPPATPGRSVVPSPSPTVLTPAALGLDVVIDTSIYRPDGHVVTPQLPAGSPFGAKRLPTGWLVSASRDEEHPMDLGGSYLVLEDGRVRAFDRAFRGGPVSADGTVVVGILRDALVAYELPSMREIGRHPLPAGSGLFPIGIAGDRALLMHGDGRAFTTATVPTIRSAVWNYRTGALHENPPQPGALWELATAGQVLRRVDRVGPDGTHVLSSCLDVVPLGDTVPLGATGWCAPEVTRTFYASIAPNAGWAVLGALPIGEKVVVSALVRVDDLRAGRYRPIRLNLPPEYEVKFWDTDRTFIAREILGDRESPYRCDVSGACLPVELPPKASIVPRYG